MFVICREGHLGYYLKQDIPIFLEKESAIFPSRRDCLDYLVNKCGVEKEQAVSAITLMQKSGYWISF